MPSNPTTTTRGYAGGQDDLPVSGSSMLIRFIYDTSSFSDILAQLTFVSSTTEPVPEEDHEHITERTDADSTEEGKHDKSAGK
ncbi:hypothetical protein NW759_004171 [Fusarium solani]|nr:hypothetical protein NW759_004171 [Fusarium solani]